jgi:hypothetical protein
MNTGHHVLTIMAQGESPADSLPFAGRGWETSGLLVFSSNRTVLFANKAAHDLLVRLHRQETEPSSDGRLPKSLEHLLDEILTLLRIPVERRGWRRFAAKRLGEATVDSVVVQAFGGPYGPDRQRSLIVLTLHHAERLP